MIYPLTSMCHLTLDLHNITEHDQQFLSELVALFTDPAQAHTLDLLRAGKIALKYGEGLVEARSSPHWPVYDHRHSQN